MRRVNGLVLAVVIGGATLTGISATVATAAPAPSAGSGFRSVSPERLLDTRYGTGTGGATNPVGQGATITLDLSAKVPASATAVVLNVTGTAPTAPPS